MTLTVGSLFSGIGGLDLGLERAGMRVKWQAEVDPYCCRVLAKHWPHVPNWGDVRDDERWLWPEFARCLGLLRPRFALVENVSGLLTANHGRAMGEVLGDLADLGYNAEWSLVSACSLGAPHARERVFVVAHRHSRGREASGPRRVRDDATPAARRMGGEHVYPASLPGCGRGGSPWASEPGVGRMVDGLSARVDDHARVRRLGNAVVPQVAEWIGRRIIDAHLAERAA